MKHTASLIAAAVFGVVMAISTAGGEEPWPDPNFPRNPTDRERCTREYNQCITQSGCNGPGKTPEQQASCRNGCVDYTCAQYLRAPRAALRAPAQAARQRVD
jgi:hypothetical protein